MQNAHYERVSQSSVSDRPACPDDEADSARKRSARPTFGISKVGNGAVFVDNHSLFLIEIITCFGDIPAKQFFKLFVAYVSRFAAVVGGQFCRVVRASFGCTLSFNDGLQYISAELAPT